MEPIDLVSQMVLDNGHRWGEVATAEQWADMRALLDTDGPRRHFWLRARGRAKTWDAAAGTLAVMLSGRVRAGDEMYAAAAGRDQAGQLARKIASIRDATPELEGAIAIQQYKVVTPRTGAVLEILSSELASSWGKTPRWLFIDEICNHDNTQAKEDFVTALLTSLPKRGDSVGLISSTPSAPVHWAYKRWQVACTSDLWRASVVAGPAPWQDPAELEDERAYLLPFMWRRLFECEWAAADDALADETALAECTRDGMLGPEPGTGYVIGFDLGLKQDHSAVAVAHTREQGGQRAVVVDRLYGWVPPAGGRVDLGEVLDTVAGLSRQYNGAAIAGDPWQAAQRIQDMREAGYAVREPSLTAGANSKRAQLLMRLVRDRALEIPADTDLRREFLSLRLEEGITPGTVKLVSDGSSKGHFDRVMAVMYAAEELIRRPAEGWRHFQGGLRECLRETCGRWYLATEPSCKYCGEPNPEPLEREPASAKAAGPVPVKAAPGGYLAANLPPGAVRCPQNHIYNGNAHGDHCPVCSRSIGGQAQLPDAFRRALGIGPFR